MKKNIFEIMDKQNNLLLSNKTDIDFLVGLCIEKYIYCYGIDKLSKIGISLDNRLLFKHDENVEELLSESFEFIFFSQLFEDFLLENHKAKTGTFYTPNFVIDYMVNKSIVRYLSKEINVDESLIYHCLEKNIVLSFDEMQAMVIAIDKVKIIDISCGTGLFLIHSLKIIFQIKTKLANALDILLNEFETMKNIVENNLFGIDIQQKPIDIAKMVISSMVYDKNVQAKDSIKFNLYVGDALSDDVFLSSKSLSNVQEENKGFDIVIGNPPYMGEKGNKDLFRKVKETTFGMEYYEGKMDYFYFFIYRGLGLLNEHGTLSYITTNYFVTADGAKKLRKYLREKCSFLEILNFNDYEIFKSAKGQHNMIFSLKNSASQSETVKIIYPSSNVKPKDISSILSNDNITNQYITSQLELYDTKGNIVIQENCQYDSIINKILKYCHSELHEVCNVNQGIVSGADKITKEILNTKLSKDKLIKYNFQVGQGIFVLSEEEAKELEILESSFLKPMYKNSDIQRYFTKEKTSRYILYIEDDFENISTTNNLILKHLGKFKSVLEKRRETMNGSRRWYALQWPRNKQIFEGDKIVVPHRAKFNKFAYVSDPWYASADVYFITLKHEHIDKYFLLGQLNSKLMYFWLFNRGKRKGENLELYANPLKQLPILRSLDNGSTQKVSNLVHDMNTLGKENYISQQEIDNILYQAYNLSEKEIEMIEELFSKVRK